MSGGITIADAPSEIETVGNTKLAQVDNMYFMYQGDGSSGVMVRLNGTPWMVGQNGPWRAVGAEQTASGYSVWWQNGSANQFVQWSTDFAGNYTSNGAIVWGTTYALESTESSFQQDLNGDGTIGVVSSNIETAGNTKLAQVAEMYFIYQGDGSSGVMLRLNGTPWAVGQNGLWRALGAEQTASGYSVWWRNGTADQYVQWTTDFAGNYTSNGAYVTGASYTLQTSETAFQQDLNGDGTVGVVSSNIETAGNAKLARVADMYFMYQGDGSSGVVLRYNGAPWTVGQNGGPWLGTQTGGWRAIGAEQTANGYSVWWRNGTADSYARWTTDFAGNYISIAEYATSGSSVLQSNELTFQQDLNGDGTIGYASSDIETVGNTKLAQVADMWFMYQGDGSSGVLVRYNGSAANPAGASWRAIGAEQTASGYSVWWSFGVNTFVQWNTDFNGNYVSSSRTMGRNGYALEAAEPVFQQDFNGDGTLGIVSSDIETVGNTKLAQVADAYFAYQGDGSSGVILGAIGIGDYLGVAQGPYGIRALGIEQQANGDYEVVMKNGSQDEYQIWGFHANGRWFSRPYFWTSGSSPEFQAVEVRFQQDFNGDGGIGTGSSGSSAAAGDVTLFANYMASAFAERAGDGMGVVANTPSSDQDFLTRPAA